MESRINPLPYQGPWGARVTLPRLVPKHFRLIGCVLRNARLIAMPHSKHTLYNSGLLNQHLLPLTSVIEPELEEVKAMLQEVEKKHGTATVSDQFNPWAPIKDLDKR